MHDIIDFLKTAVTRGNASVGMGGGSGCYIVQQNTIYAVNMIFQVGIEWPSKRNFMIAADAFDAALSRIKEVKSLKITDDLVIVSGGRLRAEIKNINEEPPGLPTLPEEWQPSPPGLTDALKKAKPFIGDRVWQQGVCLTDNRVISFSPRAGVEIQLPGFNLPKQYLLTEPVVTFLIAQGDPDEYAAEDQMLNFRWEDGRWLRTKLLDDQMPLDMIDAIFAKALGGGKEDKVASVKLDDSWKEALADAEAMADSTVMLFVDGFQAVKEHVTTQVDLDVNVPADHTSHWEAKALGAVLEIADAWNPCSYPQPAFYKGEGLRGVIAGYRK